MRRYARGTISLGPACNNRCIFCFYAEERGKPDLTTREAMREIQRAREAIAGDTVTFSGGEPAIRSDIAALCAYARRAGFKGVNMQTNARALADRGLVRALKRAGLASCFVSFHADTALLCERLTGARRGLAEAMEGLGNLEEARIPFSVNTVVCRDNVHRLRDIHRLLRCGLPSLRSLRLSFPRITGAALTNFDRVVPRFDEIGAPVRETIRAAKRDGMKILCDQFPPCVLGQHADCDIARERSPYWISDRAAGGPVGPAYAMKFDFCLRCAAIDRCCGIPIEYARRFGYRAELRPMKKP